MRDDPPTAEVKPVSRKVGQTGFLLVRIDDDRSSHSRVDITFRTAGRQVAQAFRSVPTNRWVKFRLRAESKRTSGSICVQKGRTARRSSRTGPARTTSFAERADQSLVAQSEKPGGVSSSGYARTSARTSASERAQS